MLRCFGYCTWEGGAGRDTVPYLQAVSSVVGTRGGPEAPLRIDFVGTRRGHYLVTERDDWNVEPALREAFRAFTDGSRFRGSGPSAEVLEEWTVDRQMRHLLEETGLL